MNNCIFVALFEKQLIEFEMLLFAIHIAFLCGSFFVLRIRRKDIERYVHVIVNILVVRVCVNNDS
jgi:hypothetical protein